MILSDVCKFIVDCPHSTAPDEGKGYPLIRTPNVGKGRLDLNGVHRVSESVYKQRIQRGAPRANDLIFAREAPAGNVALVQENQTVCLGQRTVLIRPNVQKVNPQYLVYYLLSPKPQYELLGTANGATVAHVNLPAIRNLKIELPEKSVQDKIGTILVTYDDLIENNQKQIKLLEEAAQRLYKEWFVDLRFPGHENTKIVDGVPEGWSKSTVSEVSAVLRRGISPKYNENARGIVINQKCIRQTIVSYDEARTQEKKYPAELELKEADIAICSTGAGTLGRVGQIYEVRENTTLDSHVTLIRANEKIGQQYLFWSLKMQQDYLMSAGKGSTNQLELSRETIGNCKILMPEQKIAEQAEKNFVAIHNKMKECSMQIARLREVRDLLLPKLMSGGMEV